MTVDTSAPRSAGSFLLYRKDGAGLKRTDRPADRARAKAAGARTPWFRHTTYAAAELEAKRLLQQLPDSTFIILQEVGRVASGSLSAAPEPEASCETSPGQVICHCSEDDGVPDVGISIGLGGGSALWIGELLASDGASFGFVFHGSNGERIAAPMEQWDVIADMLRHHIAPAIARLAEGEKEAVQAKPRGTPAASTRYDVSDGNFSLISDDHLSNLAAKIAEDTLSTVGGYVVAAFTIMQAAASLLVTKMPPAAAAQMMFDLGHIWSETIAEKMTPEGAVQ